MNGKNPPSNTARTQKTLKIYKLVALISLLAVLILSIVTFLTCITDSGRYLKESFQSVLLYIVITLTVLFAFSALFVFKGDKNVEVRVNTVGKYAGLLSLLGVISIYVFAIGKLSEGFDARSVIFLVTSVFSLIFCLSDLVNVGKTFTMLSGYLQIVFCIVVIVKLYNDMSVQMNAPIKLFTLFAAASMMVCTISELRIIAECPSAGSFVFSKILFGLFATLSGVFALIEFFTGVGKYVEDYRVFPIFFLVSAIPSLFRFFAVSVTDKQKRTPRFISSHVSKQTQSDADSSSEPESVQDQ